MRRLVSSEPEASRRPDLDQLLRVSVDREEVQETVPQSVDASQMAAELVDDVEVVDPIGIAIDGTDAALAATGALLPPEQPIVQTFAHVVKQDPGERGERLVRMQGPGWREKGRFTKTGGC
jgi:hypothetical protein